MDTSLNTLGTAAVSAGTTILVASQSWQALASAGVLFAMGAFLFWIKYTNRE